jgi:hypothetical protein
LGSDHRHLDLVEVDLAEWPGGLKDGRRIAAEKYLRRNPE